MRATQRLVAPKEQTACSCHDGLLPASSQLPNCGISRGRVSGPRPHAQVSWLSVMQLIQMVHLSDEAFTDLPDGGFVLIGRLAR